MLISSIVTYGVFSWRSQQRIEDMTESYTRQITRLQHQIETLITQTSQQHIARSTEPSYPHPTYDPEWNGMFPESVPTLALGTAQKSENAYEYGNSRRCATRFLWVNNSAFSEKMRHFGVKIMPKYHNVTRASLSFLCKFRTHCQNARAIVL